MNKYFASPPPGHEVLALLSDSWPPPLVLQYFYSFVCTREKASRVHSGLMIMKHAFKSLWKGVIRPSRTLTIAFHGASPMEVIVLIFSLVCCRASKSENLFSARSTGRLLSSSYNGTVFQHFLSSCWAFSSGRITSKLLILERVMKFNHKNRTHTHAAALIMMLLSRLALPTKLISFLWFFFARFFLFRIRAKVFITLFIFCNFFRIQFLSACLSHWMTTAKWVLRSWHWTQTNRYSISIESVLIYFAGPPKCRGILLF